MSQHKKGKSTKEVKKRVHDLTHDKMESPIRLPQVKDLAWVRDSKYRLRLVKVLKKVGPRYKVHLRTLDNRLRSFYVYLNQFYWVEDEKENREYTSWASKEEPHIRYAFDSEEYKT